MNKFIFLIPLFASCLTIASAQSTVEKAPNPVKKSPTTIVINPLKDEVQQDPNVKPTISSEPQDPNIAKAERIVIKVSIIGGKVSYTTEKSKKLATTADLKAYINEQIKIIKKKGLQPALHLKAHRYLPWKDIQTVMKVAAKAGIIDVHFSSFKKKSPEEPKAK